MRAPASVLGLVFGVACGDGGGQVDPPPDPDPLRLSFLTALPMPIFLEANVPRVRRRAIQLPADFELGTLSSITADVTATLDHIFISRTDGGTTGTPTIELAIRVGDVSDASDDCVAGVEAGRVTITGDATFASKTASRGQIAVGAEAIAMINTGTYNLCTVATSSVPAMVTLDGVVGELAMTPCTTPPQEVAGVYRGTYSCSNQCDGVPSGEGGDIELTIQQSGPTAVYLDPPAAYFGRVCGGSFRHLGGAPGYWEYGELTFDGGSAAKHSTWVSTFTNCGGTCTDQLTRVR